MCEKAKRNIKQAQDRQKKQYDTRRCPILFKYGDKVLHKNLLRNDRKGGRFIERWNGPYSILECLRKTPTNCKIPMVLHFKRKQMGVT